MSKYIWRLSSVLLSVLLLAACSMFSPIKKGPIQGYVLNAAPSINSKMRRTDATVLVLHPETNPVYDSTKIAFTLKPYQVTYYTQNHWVETPGSMLEPLLVKTLQRTKRYKSVLTPPYTGTYDYALRTQLQELRIDFTHKVPVLRMALQAQLINAGTNNLISSREFSSIVPMSACSPYAAVVAANRATARILGKMAKWTTINAR